MKKFVLCFLFMANVFPAYAQTHIIHVREDFDSLDNWRPVFFPKIKKHSTYILTTESTESFLKTESDDSASAIVYKDPYNVYEYPRLRWRWKIDNVYKKAEAGKKEGDDYPIRVYVLFKYDPLQASTFQKIIYETAKLIYGEYPPHSGLNYAWANRPEIRKILPSPYTEKVRMLFLEEGLKSGEWINEDVNVLEDYRRAFGNMPPAMATLGIMNDSDNTGERSTSYVDYIEIIK